MRAAHWGPSAFSSFVRRRWFLIGKQGIGGDFPAGPGRMRVLTAPGTTIVGGVTTNRVPLG